MPVKGTTSACGGCQMWVVKWLQYTFQHSVYCAYMGERVPCCKMANAGIVRKHGGLNYNLRNLRYIDGDLVILEMNHQPILGLSHCLGHYVTGHHSTWLAVPRNTYV